MPKIISTATADAPYKIPQSEIKNFIYNLFSGAKIVLKGLLKFLITLKFPADISIPPEWLAGKRHFIQGAEWNTSVKLR